MPDVENKALAGILGRALVSATAIFSAFRKRIAARVAQTRSLFSAERMLDDFFEPQVDIVTEGAVAAFVAGAADAAEQSPEEIPDVDPADLLPDLPTPTLRIGDSEQLLERLLTKRIVTRDEFDQMERAARSEAFTVARLNNEQAVGRIRQLLADDIASGTSERSFRKLVEADLEGSRLGPAHVETVYRNNMQRLFHDGIDRAVNSEPLRGLFPYMEYIPIIDSRTRPEHLALGSLGLNGTGVYRRDDPFWQVFRPPWQHNCRCTTNPLTLRQAARKGVEEAQRWLDSGVPPVFPEFRLNSIPFPPDPSFVS